jgi:hypothetical protein
MRWAMPLVSFAFAVSVPFLSGCDDGKKAAEKSVSEAIARLAPVVKEDVEQVRKGLPEASKKMGQLLENETGDDINSVQRAVGTARASVHDFAVSKVTFLSYADTTGTVIKSEDNLDYLAHKNVFGPFPVLKKAADPASGLVETFGEMPEMRGVKTGPDLVWVVAHPIKSKDEKLKGVFVTGWSYRLFARHLEDAVKRDMAEQTAKEGKKYSPILYVFVLKGGKAYGGIQTPDINMQAVEAQNLIEKTAQGPYKSTIELTNRSFAVGAVRTPELGDDAGIALLLSDF